MKDFLGRDIREGDVVARAIFSRHTFHRVERITKKGIYLSRGLIKKQRRYPRYGRNPETGDYELQYYTTHEWTEIGGSPTIEGVLQHDRTLYVNKDTVSLVFIM